MEIMGEVDEDPTQTIYLVRHGETKMNDENLMRGWDDPALNAEGKRDAENAGKALQGVVLDRIYSSDLRRALQTAQTILEFQTGGAELGATPDLRTIDVGAWTGKPMEQVEAQMIALQAEWQTNPAAEAPAGESWNEFQGRMLSAWQAVRAGGAERVAVVTHLRPCIWWLGFAVKNGVALRGRDLDILNRLHQTPGGISTLTYSRAQGFKILAVSGGDGLPV